VLYHCPPTPPDLPSFPTRRSSDLGWRGLDNYSDVWSVAATPGSDGMKVWYRTPFDTRLITDHGETFPSPWSVMSRVSKGVRYHRSEEHTSELQSLTNLVCRLLLEK